MEREFSASRPDTCGGLVISVRVYQRSQLAYCSNVHAGETLQSVCDNLHRYLANVRKARELKQMGAGLWLTQSVASALVNDDRKLKSFRDSLNESGIALFTLNGFPYGDFHAGRVKEAVYSPDWTMPSRYEYTINLARILSICLPDDMDEGSISTLPLGFRPGWTSNDQQKSTHALVNLAAELEQIFKETGKKVRVCLEPEPGCVLESTDDILSFFKQSLVDAARCVGIEAHVISEYLGVCFDTCHQAVMFEDVDDALLKIHQAGISIGKIQLSSALEVSNPESEISRQALMDFVEPRYLHQVRSLDKNNNVSGVMDLPEALDNRDLSGAQCWRVHFHLPLQQATVAGGVLKTTQDDVGKVLDVLASTPGLRPHLEVETYTWHVLPQALRADGENGLITDLHQELAWVEMQMSRRGLLEQAV